MEPKLYIFDLDGTLADRESGALLPNVAAWFAGWDNTKPVRFACATNQGGVSLHYFLQSKDKPEDAAKYPDKFTATRHVYGALAPLPVLFDVFICYAYQTKTGHWLPKPVQFSAFPEQWNPKYRKPAPGMLKAAMRRAHVGPNVTLMVGDREEDRLAAAAAGCTFADADAFFGRR